MGCGDQELPEAPPEVSSNNNNNNNNSKTIFILNPSGVWIAQGAWPWERFCSKVGIWYGVRWLQQVLVGRNGKHHCSAVQKGVPFVKMLFGKSFAYLTSPWETLVSHPNDSEFGIESLVASPEYWRKHNLLGHTFALGWMFKNLLQIIGILVTLASFREETETTLRQRRNAMRSVFIRRAKKYLSLSN